MGQNDNGITQSPWTNPVVPTHDAGSGDQGIGGGLDPGAGANGLTAIPWSNPIVPTPANMEESGPFGNPSRYSVVDGSTRKDESELHDITMPPLRTVDRK